MKADDRATPAGGDPYASWDAAYVLGALSTAERHEFEAHLTTCESCRLAVGELAGMPALLGLLNGDDVRSIDDSGRSDVERAGPPPRCWARCSPWCVVDAARGCWRGRAASPWLQRW